MFVVVGFFVVVVCVVKALKGREKKEAKKARMKKDGRDTFFNKFYVISIAIKATEKKKIKIK